MIALLEEALSDFLERLNEADLGGKNLHMSGDKIIAVYKKCYCNIPKKVEQMNKTYCECSAGCTFEITNIEKVR